MNLIKRMFAPTIGCFNSKEHTGRLHGIEYKRQNKIDPNPLSYIWNGVPSIAESLFNSEKNLKAYPNVVHSFAKNEFYNYTSHNFPDNNHPTSSLGIGRENNSFENTFSEYDKKQIIKSNVKVEYHHKENTDSVFGSIIKGDQKGFVFDDFIFKSRITRGGKNVNKELSDLGGIIEFLESLYSSPFQRFIDNYKIPLVYRKPNVEEEIDIGIRSISDKVRPYFKSVRGSKYFMPDFAWSIPVYSSDFPFMYSAGRGAGVNHDQTLLHGAYEFLEDFCLYGDIKEDYIRMDKLNLSFLDSNLQNLFTQLNNVNKLYLGVYNNPFGIPTYRVFDEKRSGFGCNFDGGIALTRALLELIPSMEDEKNNVNETIDKYNIPNYSTGSAKLDLERFDQIMKENKLMLDYVDLSQKESNLLVYRTFISRKLYDKTKKLDNESFKFHFPYGEDEMFSSPSKAVLRNKVNIL